jgi:RNA polymerase sigma-70 factor (ECF subfamily)
MMAEETGRLLREMIARLPPQDREMLLLKHAHRWTYQQIADHLGLPFDTVVYRLARARLRARRLLAASQRDAVAL